MDGRQDLGKSGSCEYNICHRIQQGAEAGAGIGASGNGSVDHVCEAADQIQRIKGNREYRIHQHPDTAQDPKARNKICNLFLHDHFHRLFRKQVISTTVPDRRACSMAQAIKWLSTLREMELRESP